ncbi:MAG: ACP S-malonyltransferase [Thermoanaerobaculia bacterium]|nr:ACP S-malonyltransferase [Thermoanaerobaculia bacterium]
MVADDRGTALVFPGQGSQWVGMGRDWADAHPLARETFAEADEALGEPLSRLAWEGPDEELQLTANAQPAIVAASVAVWRVARAAGLRMKMTAGHSLGEYTALVAAEALSFADALRLVRRRGELMQEAVPVGVGAMAAILGPDAATVAAVAAEAARDQVCAVANFNAPAQTVIAGHRAAVERAVELAQERGARRAVMLPVSAPFHSSLMAPAREALEPYLAETAFADPRVPVVVNVDARPVDTAEAAREALVRQVDSPVRWVESVEWMAAHGAARFVEIGPKAVLTAMIKRIAPGVEASAWTRPEELTAAVREGGDG